MKKTAVALFLMICGVWALSLGAAAAAPAPAKKKPVKAAAAKSSSSKKTSSKKPVASSSKKKSTARRAVSSSKAKTTAKKKTSTASAKRRTSSKARSRSTASRSSVQARPTADRYREIQQALAQRGYLQSEPSGTWNAESVEAMRRFQQDQNLDPSGKLDSLSLIALGLGPKRTASTQVRPQDNDYRSTEGSQRP